jgi:hypothetical protein
VAKSKRKPTSARTGPARTQSQRSPAGSTPTGSTPTGSTPTGPPTPKDGETRLRMAVADRSRGIVVLLSRQPPFLVPAVMVALMIAGLAAPTVFAVPALLVILLFVGWLAFLSWPVLGTSQRAVRLFLIAVVVVAGIGRVAGWF